MKVYSTAISRMMINARTGCNGMKYRVKGKFGILAMETKYTIKRMVRKLEKTNLGPLKGGRLLPADFRRKQSSKQIFKKIARYIKSDEAKNLHITSKLARNMPVSFVKNILVLYFAISPAI